MNILNWLYEIVSSAFMMYWTDVLVVIVFIGGLVWLYKRGKEKTVRQIILKLVVEAEKKLGSETGELKFNEVISNLYLSLPFLVKLLFTKEQLKKFIEDAVEELKIFLADDYHNLLSYEEELKAQG